MSEAAASPSTVRSVGLKFGLYYGVFSIAYFLVIALVGANPFDNKWNWISLIFAVGIVVWAHIAFKNEGDGFMSFGQGVGIGFWLSLVSLVIGGVFTYFYSAFIDASLLEGVFEKQRLQMEQQGSPENQIEVAQEWTRKLFWYIYGVFGMFFSMLVAVVVTIFTQRKNPELLA